jgi:hypothetical protein
MIPTVFVGCAAVCATKTYYVCKDIVKHEHMKEQYLKSITSSLNLDINKLEQYKSFILQHTVPSTNNSSIIKIDEEKHEDCITKEIIPHINIIYKINEYGHMYPSNEIGYTIEEIHTRTNVFKHHATFITDPTFGLSLLNKSSKSTIIPKISSIIPTILTSDYGGIRDEMKKYNILLNLNNVGNVRATIYNCSDKVLYFGTQRIGNQLIYKSMSTNVDDIVADEYYYKIHYLKDTRFITSFGFLLFGICAFLYK